MLGFCDIASCFSHFSKHKQSIKYFRIEEQEGTSVKMIVFHAFMLTSNQLGVFLDEKEQLIACQNWFPVLSYPWVLKLLILTTMSNILLL